MASQGFQNLNELYIKPTFEIQNEQFQTIKLITIQRTSLIILLVQT